jgi:hypothetical protein
VLGPVQLVLCHGWVGVAAAPEILKRRPSGLRDAIPLPPFRTLYRPANAPRASCRTTDEFEQAGFVMLTLLSMSR